MEAPREGQKPDWDFGSVAACFLLANLVAQKVLDCPLAHEAAILSVQGDRGYFRATGIRGEYQ